MYANLEKIAQKLKTESATYEITKKAVMKSSKTNF